MSESTAISINMQEVGAIYSSFKAETKAEKAVLYNMLTASGERLADMINQKIKIKDFTLTVAELEREETQSMEKVPRVSVLTVDGKIYSCTSLGIGNCLRALVEVWGLPTWPDGVEVIVKQVSRGERKMLTMVMA